MIGKDQIAEACRNADAGAEEHGLPAYLASKDVDSEGLVYVAMQRALRVIMIERGDDPRAITRATSIGLNARELARQHTYAAVFMDGFAAGLTARSERA